MSAYVGGLRARLIRDSVFRMIHTALEDLGWLNQVASRSDVTFVIDPVDINAPVAPNSAAMSDDLQSEEDAELGSNLAIFDWPMYVDFFGENGSVSLHFIRDVAAILAGRMPSVGRSGPTVVVFDWTLATPVPIFVVEIEDVRTDKAHDFPHPWLRNWRSCTFRVIDSYADEGDP